MIRPPTVLSPLQRQGLQAAYLADPPPALRARILERNQLPAAVRFAPILAAVTVLALLLVVPGNQPAADRAAVADHVDWRARSAQMERIWQQIGDRDWLRGDVRAAPISHRLRVLDERLTLAQLEPTAGGQLDELWRERSETLAELVALRQQGGYAIRL